MPRERKRTGPAGGYLVAARTGDIATIDRRGFVTIVDRVKDLVKSGGEWTSSVEEAGPVRPPTPAG